MKSWCTVDRSFAGRGWFRLCGTAAGFAFVASAGSVSPALAQSVGEPPIAQALFEEARGLMTAGHYEEACSKFAESQRLDKASGTLLNLALCHEKLGKTATAWAEYNDVVATARVEGNSERHKIALERTRELEPKLCHLSVVSTPDVTAKGNFLMRVDGMPLGAAAWGVAIPVDPGSHVVEVTVAGKKPWSGNVDMRADGSSWVITVIAPEDDGAETALQDDAQVASNTAARRRLPYLIGGAGALFLGAGVFLGLHAKADWDERNRHCPGNVCDQLAVDAGNDAHKLALATDGAFAVGLVGIGLATYFAVTEPKKPASASSFGLSLAGDQIRLDYGGHF
jgi:hypothetical protein